ncbi:MAG: sigma-54 interaction domain-containing protein [Candidatus Binatia bacterium]
MGRKHVDNMFPEKYSPRRVGGGGGAEESCRAAKTARGDPELLVCSNNSAPVTVLRELLSQCEKISAKGNIALCTERAYVDPHRRMLLIPYNVEGERFSLEKVSPGREIEGEHCLVGIIGQSEKMHELIALVRSIAQTEVTVLVQGETGTGKELIARGIHYNSSRRTKRFVAVNCGSLAETLLESELFGHEKGAFTGAMTQRKGIFEVADGGTLFLDEVSEIPPSTQVKLLRVLQEGEFQRVGGTDSIRVDIRVVAATNQNLEERIRSGNFRQDLYYRLNVVPIQVPPLRERNEDIPLLMSHFIDQCNQRMDRRIRGVSPQATAFLMAYTWPGNIRQLENVIQRMVVVAKGEMLDVHDLPAEIRGVEEGPQDKVKDLKDIARETAGLAEKSVVLDTLAQNGWNVTRAARSLGVSRVTLQKKMKTYNLRDHKIRPAKAIRQF